MQTRRIILVLGVCALLALAAATLARNGDGPAQAQQSSGDSPKATPSPGIPADALQAPSWAGTQMSLQMQGLIEAPAPEQPAGRGPFAPAAVLGASDVLVNGDSGFQNETTLAVRGNTICAGYNDSGPGGFSGLSRSPDLGISWTDQGGIGQAGDPVLAVHQASGVFYYAELAFIGGATAIAVAKSTDDCNSFPTMANASPATSAPPDLQDKPWIAVDNTGGPRDGYVYVCWTRFVDFFPGPPTSDEILISRSTDGGITFGDEQVISPLTDSFPFGCHIDVGPSGEVYVTWADRNFLADFPIRFRRSLDGALTWDAIVQVNTGPIRHPGLDRIIDCGGGNIRTTLNGDIRMLHQAWMAADTTGGPFNGNIYIVWAHDPAGATDNSDVFFSHSSDGGLTWTPEVQLAGGTVTDQFEPYVEVGGQGTVSIAWYDRRNDPVDNFNMDVYTAFSSDGGATLFPISRLSDVSFPPIVFSCYMGEYIAIAADASSFYYAWGDNRNIDPDVFFDRQAVVVDSDADGCTDKQELQPKSLAAAGGGRDPFHFWDFFDVWTQPGPARDLRVDGFDIGAVVARFGTALETPLTKEEALAQALTPPPDMTSYHAAFDRKSPPLGANVWNLRPADGRIDGFDIGFVVVQFGHSCA